MGENKMKNRCQEDEVSTAKAYRPPTASTRNTIHKAQLCSALLLVQRASGANRWQLRQLIRKRHDNLLTI
jgi:hypothetical protein